MGECSLQGIWCENHTRAAAACEEELRAALDVASRGIAKDIQEIADLRADNETLRHNAGKFFDEARDLRAKLESVSGAMGEQVDIGAIQRHYEALLADLRVKLESVSGWAGEKQVLLAKLEQANDGLIEYARQITKAEARVRRLEEALRMGLELWENYDHGGSSFEFQVAIENFVVATRDALNPPSAESAA